MELYSSNPSEELVFHEMLRHEDLHSHGFSTQRRQLKATYCSPLTSPRAQDEVKTSE